MKDKIKPAMRGTIDEKTDILGNDGLRTLVYGYRELSPRQLRKWKHEYEKAQALLNNRQKFVDRVIERLEVDLELLGITGVEDKLQDNVV